MTAKSKYSSIWEALKKDGHCSVAVHKELHARVIKAVIKRKDLDLRYKLLKSDQNTRVLLRVVVTGVKIKFILEEFRIVKELMESDF